MLWCGSGLWHNGLMPTYEPKNVFKGLYSRHWTIRRTPPFDGDESVPNFRTRTEAEAWIAQRVAIERRQKAESVVAKHPKRPEVGFDVSAGPSMRQTTARRYRND